MANTYFASTTGSISNIGSISSPWTFAYAKTQLFAGDTLYVRGGTYDATITGMRSGTSWGTPITIANYNGETVWLTPSSGTSVIVMNTSEQYNIIDGINLDSRNQTAVTISLGTGGVAKYNRFQNFEIIGSPLSGFCANICGGESCEFLNLTVHGGGESLGGCGSACANAGIYTGGSNNLIDNCNVYDTSMEGIQIYNGGGGTPTNNRIRHTKVHGVIRSGDSSPGARCTGILISGDSNEVSNCQVYSNGILLGDGGGINVYTGNDNLIVNNTVTGNINYGIKIDGGANRTIVRNNISYNNAGGNYTNSGSSTYHDHNLDDGTDPRFTNAGSDDYTLLSTSVCIDAGTTIAGITDDYAGGSRPRGAAFDIGAYEYGSVPTPPLVGGGGSGSTTSSGIAWTTSLLKCAPSAANGVTVTPNAVAWNNSTYTTVIAAAAADSVIVTVIIWVPDVNADMQGEIDLAVGGAGSEVVKGTVKFGCFAGGPKGEYFGRIELPIGLDCLPSGGRLAVRMRHKTGNTLVWHVAVEYYEKPITGTIPYTTQLLRITPSATDCTTISGQTNWVNGSWTQLVASTASDLVIIGVPWSGNNSGVETEVDLATGASGSEVVKTTLRWASISAFPGWPAVLMLRAPLKILSGQRIAARARHYSPTNFDSIALGLMYYHLPL
jgi:parallel beta-helix repeat protein